MEQENDSHSSQVTIKNKKPIYKKNDTNKIDDWASATGPQKSETEKDREENFLIFIRPILLLFILRPMVLELFHSSASQ